MPICSRIARQNWRSAPSLCASFPQVGRPGLPERAFVARFNSAVPSSNSNADIVHARNPARDPRNFPSHSPFRAPPFVWIGTRFSPISSAGNRAGKKRKSPRARIVRFEVRASSDFTRALERSGAVLLSEQPAHHRRLCLSSTRTNVPGIRV